VNKKIVLVALACCLFLAIGASAQEKGSLWVNLGAHVVDPKSDNGSVAGGAFDVTVGDSLRPSVMLEYFVADNLGIEVLAAWPFSHDVELNGTKAATVDHLPPTLSLQYHFNGSGAISPYLGVGLNYTLFFSEDTTGPINGADLSLGSSWGLAAHGGVNFKLGERWGLGVDLRWIDIDTDVDLNGSDIGTVEIDPLAYGAYFRTHF
jgi:outer membrane protein